MAGSLTVLHNTPSEAVAEKAVTEKAILPETGVAATEATAKTDEALAKEVTEEVTEETAEEIAQGESLASALLETALVVTEQVADPQWKISLLIQIAIAQSETGTPEAATATLETALAATPDIEDAHRRAQDLIAIATTFHNAAHDTAGVEAALSEAIALVHTGAISTFSQPGMLLSIAEAYIDAGEYEQAYAIPAYVETFYLRAEIERLLVRRSAEGAVAKGKSDRLLEFILASDFGVGYIPDNNLENNTQPRAVPVEITISEQLTAISVLIEAHQQNNSPPEKTAELLDLYESMVAQLPKHQDQAREHLMLSQRLLDLGENDLALDSLVRTEQILTLGDPLAEGDTLYAVAPGRYPLQLAELYVRAGAIDKGIEMVETYRHMPLADADNAEVILYKVEQLVSAVNFLTVADTQPRSELAWNNAALDVVVQDIAIEAERLTRLIPERNIYRRDGLLLVAMAYQKVGETDKAQLLIAELQPLYSAEARKTLWDTEIYQWLLLLQAVGDYAQVIEIANESDDFTVPFAIFQDLSDRQETEQIETLLALIADPTDKIRTLTLIAINQSERGEAQAELDTMRRLITIAEQENLSFQQGDIENAVRQYAEVAEPASVSELLYSITDEPVRMHLALELLPEALVPAQLTQLTDESLKNSWTRLLEDPAFSRTEDSCQTRSPSTSMLEEVPRLQAQFLIERAYCAASSPLQPVDAETNDVPQRPRDQYIF
ncbi:MAG: hypothetical protein ACFB0D_01105 [Phormidesmis sp.]